MIDRLGSAVRTKQNALILTDGVATPSTLNGTAQIYVESPTGDLRVLFSDGRDKLIVDDNISTGTYNVTAATGVIRFDRLWTIVNFAGSVTLTINLNVADYQGRLVQIKTLTNNTVSSSVANVVPIDGTTAGTAILPATAGSWAVLRSDGTNWVIQQAG